MVDTSDMDSGSHPLLPDIQSNIDTIQWYL